MYVYGLKFSNFLLLFQLLFSTSALLLLKTIRLADFPFWNFNLAKKVFPVSFWFMINIVVSMLGLKEINIPMFSTLRRLTVIPIMLSEYILLNKVSSWPKQQAVFILVLGTIIAGSTDLTFNAKGYFWIMIYCITTALFLVYQKKHGQNLNAFGLLYYNNIISLPFIVFLVWIGDEFDGAIKYPNSTWGFRFAFFLSTITAFLLNYSIFLCVKYNSPLTTSIVGHLKSIVVTLGSLFLFDDIIYSFWNIVGLIISLIASIIYTHLEFEERGKETRSKAEEKVEIINLKSESIDTPKKDDTS